MKWFFIINPISGKGDGLRIWQQINTQLVKNTIDFDYAISDYHKHALQLVAAKYQEGYRNFVGIGGDGTLNEMVNAVFHAAEGHPDHQCLFGLIPVGTGNDWVRSCESSLSSNSIVKKLEQSVTTAHDVGVVYSNQLEKAHYFLNVAGAGLDGKVVEAIARKAAKGKKGKFAYLTGLLQALFAFTAPRVEVKLTDEPFFSGQALVITAAKGRYFGGGMQISPNAKADNGSLDFTVIEKVAKRKIFPQLYKLFNGQIGSVPFVQKIVGTEIHIQANQPLAIQADGELVAEVSEFRFSLARHQIKVLS